MRLYLVIFVIIVSVASAWTQPIQRREQTLQNTSEQEQRSPSLDHHKLTSEDPDHKHHMSTSKVPKCNLKKHRKNKEKATGQVQQEVGYRKHNRKARNVDNKKGEKRSKHLKTDDDVTNLGLTVYSKQNPSKIMKGGVGNIIAAPLKPCAEGKRHDRKGICRTIYH